jgi:hypothetical protein
MAEPQSYSKDMFEKASAPLEEQPIELRPLEDVKKGRWERSWPTIACGAGLFSDGYLNQVRRISILSTIGSMSNMGIWFDECCFVDTLGSRLSALLAPCWK